MNAADRVDFTSAVANAIFELKAWQRDHGKDIGSQQVIADLRATSSAVRDLIDAAQLAVGNRAYTDRNDFALPADKQAPDVAALMNALSRMGIYP